MIVPIDSLDDERLAPYASLTELQLRSRLEPEMGIFIAESDKVIGRALDAGYEPVSMLVPDHRIDRTEQLLARVESCYDGKVPVFTASASELEKLAGFELTRGVLAAMRRKPLPDAQALLAGARRVAVLEDVTNHTNVGSIFRNAAAFGVDAVLVTPGCCDPLYRRAIRVSMGGVFKVPWTRIGESVHDWPDPGMGMLHDAGFKAAALALHDESIRLDDPALKECGKLAFLFGSEGPGLAQRTIDECDFVVKIPMQNGVDSLNVAATSAVVFWEVCGHE